MHVGFQTTVHIGSIQQTAVLEGIMAAKHISTNDTASVLFRFLQHPEFVRTGSRLLFRMGSTQGIGKVTQVFPLETGPADFVDHSLKKKPTTQVVEFPLPPNRSTIGHVSRGKSTPPL